MKTRSIRRLAAAVLVGGFAAALMLAPASPAAAHSVTGRTAETSGPPACTETRIMISEVAPAVWLVAVQVNARGLTFQQAPGGGWQLACSSTPQQVEWLYAAWELQKWDLLAQQWQQCESGWHSATDAEWVGVSDLDSIGPPCGVGMYRAVGHGYRLDDGQLSGGSVTSPSVLWTQLD